LPTVFLMTRDNASEVTRSATAGGGRRAEPCAVHDKRVDSHWSAGLRPLPGLSVRNATTKSVFRNRGAAPVEMVDQFGPDGLNEFLGVEGKTSRSNTNGLTACC
jgi:hypothetical protein